MKHFEKITSNEFPMLTGTEKQIKWANDIRQRFVELYNELTETRWDAPIYYYLQQVFVGSISKGIIPFEVFDEKEDALFEEYPGEVNVGLARTLEKEFILEESLKVFTTWDTAARWIDCGKVSDGYIKQYEGMAYSIYAEKNRK